MALLRLLIGVACYLITRPAFTYADTAANPTPVISVLNGIFAGPESANGISAVLPAITHLPCCGPNCPIGLCTPTNSIVIMTTPTPSFPDGPIPQIPFVAPSGANCIPGCCSGNCKPLCCQAFMIPTASTTAWISPSKTPLPAHCPPGDCTCGGPDNCFAFPPKVIPQEFTDQGCGPLKPGCIPGSCTCGGKCNCQRFPIPPPPGPPGGPTSGPPGPPESDPIPDPSSPPSPPASSPSEPPVPLFTQPRIPINTKIQQICIPGSCLCGGPLNCQRGQFSIPNPPDAATIPPVPLASAPRPPSHADANSTHPHQPLILPHSNPNYIPLLLQSLTAPPTPLILYAQISLATTQNIISRPILAALHRDLQIVNYAQSNSSAIGIPSTINLDIVAGIHGSKFENVEFNVYDGDVADGEAVVIVGTGFLGRAFALRVSEEYGDVVGRTQGVGVLVGLPVLSTNADGTEEESVVGVGQEGQVVMHDEL